MSWEDRNSRQFNRHGGRNAFRNADDADTTLSERAATLRAMRSFTESIDCDVPPVPELPPELDIDRMEGLKSSDTNDTIIEVMRKKSLDPTLGETQKYKLAVPGPGVTEKEHELHKSLIKDDDEETDAEVEHAMATVPSSVTMKRSRDETDEALRREYNAVALQRKRPTTPTSACVVESFAFVGAEETPPKEPNKDKIRVSIPTSRRRKGDMYDFYDNMGSQMPHQARRGSISGRTTPLNDYDGDILEENPLYKDKIPPKPVVNRRISVEWENFDDFKDQMDVDNPPPKPARAPQPRSQSEDDELPTFSEDMREERDKLRREMQGQKSPPPDAVVPVVSQKSVDRPPKPTSPPKLVKSRQNTLDRTPSVKSRQSTVEKPPSVKSREGTLDTTTEDVPGEVEEQVAVAGEEGTTEEYTYNPDDYPGYIWNYEKQEWEVDPNYDPSQYQQQEYSGEQQQYDQTQYDQYYEQQGYDQQQYAEGSYDQQASDQYHAGYDQGTETQAPTEYDYTTSAYHSGYDQGDPQSYYGTTTEYDYTTAALHAGYDQNGEQTAAAGETYPEGYDYNAEYNQNYDQSYAGYDQQGQSYPGYDEQGQYTAEGAAQQEYQYTEGQYDPNAYDYSQSYAGYDQTGQGYAEEDASYQQEPGVPQPYVPPQPEEIPKPSVTVNPFVGAPLFKSAPVEKDPYAWEADAHVEAAPPVPPAPAASTVPQVSPSRPAPPQRPVAPNEHQELQPAAEMSAAEMPAAAPPRPPPAARPPPPRPAAPPAKPEPPKAPEPEEEDPWARFKAMTEAVNKNLAQTSERMKDLEESTAVKDLKDESYLASIGGEQGYADNVAQREIQKKMDEAKEAKILKKKLKQQGKKAASPTFDPDQEDSMDKAAQELAAKLAAKMDMENWKPPVKQVNNVKREDSMSAIPPRKRSSLKDSQQDSGGSLELPAHLHQQQRDSITPKGDLDPSDPVLAAPAWTDFDTSEPVLPPSESGFFSKKASDSTGETMADPFATTSGDPFAPPDKALIEDNYDPFAIQSAEDIMAAAKAKAEEVKQKMEGREDVDFFDAGRQSPDSSSPTPEGGSPVSHNRPQAFEDDFKCENIDGETPTPLYDEDDSLPLPDYLPKYTGEGWQLMIRHPIKKKSFMAERCWKPCFVRLRDHTLYVFNNREDARPIQELLLQATYSLSDTTLQAYDIYGKIHTVKLQYVIYKEKVGIRPGQISRLVEGHVTKYGLPLEHSAQCNVLLKFGSLDTAELQSFVTTVEDILFQCPAKRDTKPIYKQDEVQVHCYDEYSAYVDKDGLLSEQKARVRLFCLAFVTGSPVLEIGLNDRRRQGKEIVRRKDILPMYTERWIRFENLEFHSTVDRAAFDTEQVIRLSPPDGCFFEIMRFRVRPPRNREKAINVKCLMKIAGSKVEIRMEIMAASQLEKSKGGRQTKRQIPCEDIAIRFPVPEAWIYIFREERHWGVGSVHSKKLRPGKVKNLKDRLLGAVQSNEPNLIEVAIGEAKYEHVYRSLVWRIPRLPEKNHAAYKSHLLKCRFELSSFDLMPETFLPRCDVDFTMPLATVSNTVVRSVSVEQHEDSDRVEKFVRYVAKCQYKVEIDYVQCADLDIDTTDPSVNPEAATQNIPELHQPTFHPDANLDLNEGYRIDFPDHPAAANDSSSDDEDDKRHKMPIIQIDMKNYGY